MGTWQGLTHQPTNFNVSTSLLLTDGRIMAQDGGSNHWHALTPDSTGSYVNGTWSQLADMQYTRSYYASGILKDGRVIVCGGEDSSAGGDTTNAQIYDPVANTWTTIGAPAGWSVVGDASSCILPDGRLMIGNLTSTACAIYNPVTNTWSAAASKAVRSNEETWILQPDNTILTLQCFAPYNAEKYIIATNTWKNEGALPASIVDPAMAEIGPGMLLPNKKVIYFGANGHSGHGNTVIYTPPASASGTGTWVAGPQIPQVGGHAVVANDCPAVLLPNGKVLFTAGRYFDNTGLAQSAWTWPNPVYAFEYDPVANTITQVTTPPNTGSSTPLYTSRMLMLPSGEAMYCPGSNNVQLYNGGGSPQTSWKPAITSVVPQYTGSHLSYFTLTGTQLNGLSQASIYGDDCTNATNYPIVQLTDTTNGHIIFARSYNFSTMGVATGITAESCLFAVNNIPHDGVYQVRVVANGIHSDPFNITVIKSIFQSAAPVAASNQHGIANQTDVFAIDKDGALTVSWVVSAGQWSGPARISATSLFPVNAAIATSNQFGLGGQTDVFVIDNSGAMTVSWVTNAGAWSGPARISAIGVFPAGGGVAASNQFGIANQTDVFAVDVHGALTVSWVVSAGNWNGPAPISAQGVFPPGAHLCASNQFGLPQQTDVFLVDNHGAMNVAWVVNAGHWNGPAPISPQGRFPAGAPVTASHQFGLAGQTDVFAVDNNGSLTVSWVTNAGPWSGPAEISAHGLFDPGAWVAASNQFGLGNQTDLFCIDKHGALNVSWVVSAGPWNGPAPISAQGVFASGAPVAASNQFGLGNQTDVFAINTNGALNVSWVVNAGAWNGPAPI